MTKPKLWVICAAVFMTAQAGADEPRFKTELENDQLRVVRVHLGPHERLPMHEIPPHVTIWLTDARLRITYADGRRELRHFRAGEVQWVAVGKHSGENVGERAVEFVAVEPSASKAN